MRSSATLRSKGGVSRRASWAACHAPTSRRCSSNEMTQIWSRLKRGVLRAMLQRDSLSSVRSWNKIDGCVRRRSGKTFGEPSGPFEVGTRRNGEKGIRKADMTTVATDADYEDRVGGNPPERSRCRRLRHSRIGRNACASSRRGPSGIGLTCCCWGDVGDGLTSEAHLQRSVRDVCRVIGAVLKCHHH